VLVFIKMSDIQSLYSQARKLILSLSAGIGKIESGATVRGRRIDESNSGQTNVLFDVIQWK